MRSFIERSRSRFCSSSSTSTRVRSHGITFSDDDAGKLVQIFADTDDSNGNGHPDLTLDIFDPDGNEIDDGGLSTAAP